MRKANLFFHRLLVLLLDSPCYDATETKSKVEDSSEEVGQRDVVEKAPVLHCIVVAVVVAIKHE